jgi:hypothetical protein
MGNVKKLIYKKHEFNIFPDMSVEEYDRLKLDIKCYGFDYVNHPIILYDNRVLDGFNRYRALVELNIEQKDEYFEPFKGNDDESMALVLRSNKRRNITQERWAFLLVQSKAILEKTKELVKKQTKEKQIEGGKNKVTPKMGEAKDRHKNETVDIVADILDTTPAQLAKAEKYEKENPVAFEQVAAGKTTIRKLNAEKKATLLKEATPVLTMSADKFSDELSEIIDAGEKANAENNDTANELTDAEILKLVRLAKNKVKKIAKNIVNKGMDYGSILINQQHFQAIEKIQIELGEKLTGYKK